MKTSIQFAAFALVSLSVLACGGGIANSSALLSGAVDPELETSADALTSDAVSVWFPLTEGNTWNFKSPTDGSTRTVSMEDVWDGIGWLEGAVPNGRFVGTSKSAPNTLYSWKEETNTWEAFFRFGYATTQWTWGQSACGTFTAKRTQTGATVTTPAGTFANTRTITFTLKPSPLARCSMPPFSSFTFAPNVGLIAMADPDGARYELTSALVNGKKIPVATTTAPVKGTLKLDKVAYVNKPNTIRCITTPCPSNEETAVAKLSYTLTNNSNVTQTWQFNSGCQLEVELMDGNGKSVNALSNGRFCTLSLTSVSLSPGQSKSYTAELPLKDREGNQLSGKYTAVAYVVARSGPSKAESVVPFSVSLAY